MAAALPSPLHGADGSAPVQLLRSVSPADVKRLARAATVLDPPTLQAAEQIVEEVRRRGVAAVEELAHKFGDLKPGEPLVILPAALEKVFLSLPVAHQKLLERTAERIRLFARAQRQAIQEFALEVKGGKCGQVVAPVDSAGCYAPGGRYPLPSSVLMTVVTAKVAGVPRVWLASPRPTAITLGAAHVAGADGVLAVGGAQAIAALAFGLEGGGTLEASVPACAVIVGPGNRWVTAAKKLVSGEVGIDLLAGPSECLVLADGSAAPDVVAADLLAQAEHDVDARPLLVTLDASLPDRVRAALATQLASLPTAAVARVALAANGLSVVCASLDEAIAVADQLAPEHLLLHVAPAHLPRLKTQLRHYGALFVGHVAAEVFGDYGVGPNHVLPTHGAARHSGGLSVLSFLRVRTWLQMDATMTTDLAELVADAAQLARLEGLEGHARAAEMRHSPSTPPRLAPGPSLHVGENLVRIGLPKGRMEQQVFRLLEDAGVKIVVGPRGYRPSLNLPGYDVKLLKPHNIVEMLSAGSRDVGFTGYDLVQELKAHSYLVEMLDTKLDPVKLVAAAPEAILVNGKELPTDRKLVVATEYLNVAQDWVNVRGIHASVVHSRGATEGWPPEDADLIVDNTATGSTLKANALQIVAELLNSTTRLYANPAALHNPVKKATIDRLVAMLRAVLQARERILLEFHVPKDKLEEMVKIVPAMRQPTVSTLYGGELYAVKIVVPRGEVFSLISTIKGHGASDIIATNLVYLA